VSKARPECLAFLFEFSKIVFNGIAVIAGFVPVGS
jgi:hypothetical protein